MTPYENQEQNHFLTEYVLKVIGCTHKSNFPMKTAIYSAGFMKGSIMCKRLHTPNPRSNYFFQLNAKRKRSSRKIVCGKRMKRRLTNWDETK
jgi:hypothetical protein